jgi:hypothetical protein
MGSLQLGSHLVLFRRGRKVGLHLLERLKQLFDAVLLVEQLLHESIGALTLLRPLFRCQLARLQLHLTELQLFQAVLLFQALDEPWMNRCMLRWREN